MRFRKGQAVRHKGWLRGVACRIVGPVLRWNDEYEEEEEVEGMVAVHMVGDDVRFTVDEDDLEELADTDFCSECGQMGCAHSIATE